MRRPLGSEYSFGVGGPFTFTCVAAGISAVPAAGFAVVELAEGAELDAGVEVDAGVELPEGAELVEAGALVAAEAEGLAVDADGAVVAADVADEELLGLGAVAEVGGSNGSLPSSGSCPSAAKGRSKLQAAKSASTIGLKLGDEQKIILPVQPPALPKTLALVPIPKHRSRNVLDFSTMVPRYARNQNHSYLFFQ